MEGGEPSNISVEFEAYSKLIHVMTRVDMELIYENQAASGYCPFNKFVSWFFQFFLTLEQTVSSRHEDHMQQFRALDCLKRFSHLISRRKDDIWGLDETEFIE
jgi:hypothetical protein